MVELDCIESHDAEQKEVNPTLAAMFAGRDKLLETSSPRQRGHEREIAALLWVYKFGFSSRAILDTIGNGKKSGLASRMVEKGLLRETRCPTGGWSYMPRTVLTLTRDGQDLAEAFVDRQLRYERNPSRINFGLIRHSICVQTMVNNSLNSGVFVSFISERELLADRSGEDLSGLPLPDAVMIDKNGEKSILEVELTSKFGRRLDQFVRGINLGLQDGPEHPYEYLQAMIFVDGTHIERRYKERLAAGARYTIWNKGPSGEWVKNQVNHGTISKSVASRVHIAQV